MAEDTDLRTELERARATIATQAMRITELEAAAQRTSGLEALRSLLQLSEVMHATVGHAPFRALLDGIVQAARRIFDAGAASILLLDHDTDELVFEAIIGGADVLNVRIPAHQGIAGWVVMTGEPIVVSDVRTDPRWARDFAESTGYVPKSILAVPMFHGDEVEGVLEVLDKASAASFGLDDMELLGLFARPAAIAVEQARLVAGIGRLLVQQVQQLADQQGNEDLNQAARTALSSEASVAEQTIELARLVYQLGRRSDRARRMAFEILSSVDRYLV